MAGLVRLVEELCCALASFDPARSSAPDCATLAAVLARVAKAASAASASAAARAVDAGVHRDLGEASGADWFARLGGATASAARDAMETMRTLNAYPATRDAVLAGEVSVAQAAEITSMPEHEAELLSVARTSGLGAVRDLARKRRLAAIEPEELSAKQRAAREFVHWKDDHGMIRFRGALPPDVGVPFVNRLERETDRCWRAARREKRDEPRAAHAADAFLKLVEGGGNEKGHADLVIVADINAYRRGHTHEGEACHIVGGGPIPVSLAREMAEDAFLKAVLHDGTDIHTVVHYGRRRSARLQTALELGAPPDFDGVKCSEEGCDRRLGLEWDHIDPVANHGPTSFKNLQAECPPHHWDKTQRDRANGLLGGRAAAPDP